MLSETDLENAIERILVRIDEINTIYIAKIAAQIKKIGEMNHTSVNRLVTMAEMGADVADITERLNIATGLNLKDLFAVYQQTLDDVYTDQRFKAYLEDHPISDDDKARLTNYAQYVSTQTGNNLINLSNTTAVAEPYSEAVDRAIFAVTMGLDSYSATMRDVIKEIGYAGLQVYYESGYHRRLDTAVRQNIIDGANQIAQNASLMMGEILGEEYNAVEISAHARSAPDHEPVQGKVFLLEEFEKMQTEQSFSDVDGRHYASFRRPIGEWNCMHIAMSFSTKYSVRRYTDKQLKEWKEANAKGCEIEGKHYTTYQAVQLMRKMETEVRRQKDVAVAARYAGDTELRKQCQYKIDAIVSKYVEAANAAGITPQMDRMSVDGFRAIKVK